MIDICVITYLPFLGLIKISTLSFFVIGCQNLGVVEEHIKLPESEGESMFSFYFHMVRLLINSNTICLYDFVPFVYIVNKLCT